LKTENEVFWHVTLCSVVAAGYQRFNVSEVHAASIFKSVHLEDGGSNVEMLVFCHSTTRRYSLEYFGLN